MGFYSLVAAMFDPGVSSKLSRPLTREAGVAHWREHSLGAAQFHIQQQQASPDSNNNSAAHQHNHGQTAEREDRLHWIYIVNDTGKFNITTNAEKRIIEPKDIFGIWRISESI